MPNITLADIVPGLMSQQVLISLTDGSAEVNQEIVDAVIKTATGYVNGFCLGEYSTSMPWNPVPDIVRSLTLTVFEFQIKTRGGRGADETVQLKYKEANKTLQLLAGGKIKIETEPGTPAPSNPRIYSSQRDLYFDNPPGYWK
ncbi:MAG: DUF1320 family protein [Candidatus Aminicenantes bacterium]|nr:DUF1320 family protein [Candidatus Aminicenantes bacterium]